MRQNLVMKTGDHSRACSILLRVESNYLRISEAEPSRFWDNTGSVFSFAKPLLSAKDRSVVGVFKLQSALGFQSM